MLAPDEGDRLIQNVPPAAGVVATHGLSVAATLAGTGVAAEGGVDIRGVATGALIVDFSTCCADVAETAGNHPEALGSVMLVAYDYMLRHQHDPLYPGGIRVATNQWGYQPGDNSPRTALNEMLAKVVAHGITVVFAAGNFGPGDNTVWPPATDLPELLVAGAACPAIDGGMELLNGRSCGVGEMADYASVGPALDIAAPVGGIWAPRYPSSAASQGEAAIPPPGAGPGRHGRQPRPLREVRGHVGGRAVRERRHRHDARGQPEPDPGADPLDPRVDGGGLRSRGVGQGVGTRRGRRAARGPCRPRRPPVATRRRVSGGQNAAVQPMGIHHVSINVDDVAAAARFYVDVLGLTARDDRPDFGVDGAWLDAGSQQLHLIAATVPAGEGQHFALHVADLDAAVAELAAGACRSATLRRWAPAARRS